MDNTIRWLHLSDFHVGKDNYAQTRLFDKIIEHVKDQVSKGFVPDLVFITGDIANKGLKVEYEAFRKEFYNPLNEILTDAKFFTVPGNHDVARPASDGLNRSKLVEPGSRFFDSNKEGKTAREQVTPRFKLYKQWVPCSATNDWLVSADGAFAEKVDTRGQHIGIVGINTAWLSMAEPDKDKLTPGFHLVESALDKIKDCPVRIVIGHHPLHWLIEDDAQRLRTLFGRHRVIYLHGHMHRTEARKEDGAGESFLVFQAGAAFQARDDEPWRNGLLWGELDCSKGELRLSPRFWNPRYMDWPTEMDGFPVKHRVNGSDWWAYDLPTSDEIKPSSWQAPDGWMLIDQAVLESHRRDISADEAERFFDGAEPDWSLALCSNLPRRAVVESLIERIASYQGKERPLVVLLTGPGGEGKSMAGRQTVVGLFERDPDLRVLWRNDDAATLTAEQLLNLPQGSSPWLVATDAADLSAKSLCEAMKALSKAGRSDVRFLLTARESDWRAAGGASLPWVNHADFHQETLSGLTEADASLIAGAWLKFGRVDCQGDAATNQDELSLRLFNAAKAEASLGEGALLGGVLVIRKGEGLRAHVRSLLDRLQQISLANGNTLYTVFGYIAAMHAEGLDFLSRPVLAEALGCKTSSLQKEVIFPLGREAAAGGGMMIRTRHHRIAVAVIEIMQEEFSEDIESYYLELVQAAVKAKPKAFIQEYSRWQYDLPIHFLKKQPELAIKIGWTLLEQDHNNAKLAVSLARIYRQSDDPEEGAYVLREFKGEVRGARSFWYEWGTCAGNASDPALSTWLACWSLADQPNSAPPDNDQAKKSLAGLGVAFAELFKRYPDRTFIEARHAMGQLGLRLRLDNTARRYFESHLGEAEAEGVKPTDLGGAFKRLQTGLLRAWENCAERDSLIDRIPKPQAMCFDGLKRLFPLG